MITAAANSWELLAFVGFVLGPSLDEDDSGEPMNRPSRVSLVDRLMNEVTIYGGLPMRRGDVCKLAREHLGPVHSREPFGAPYFAFHGPAVELEPWPLDEARKVMRD